MEVRHGMKMGLVRLLSHRAFGRLASAICVASALGVCFQRAVSAQELGEVDEIVVVGQPGPPIWHVISGASDVVILGTIAPLPIGLAWSHKRLEAGITGARRVLISPEPSSGQVWNQNFTANKIASLKLRHGQTVRTLLPPDLLARYEAALSLGRQSAQWLDQWNPAIVGVIVLDHARQALRLTTIEPNASVEALAHRHDVRVQHISQRAGMPTLDGVPGLSQTDQIRCLQEHLDDVDLEKSAAAELASAWVKGDLALLRQRYHQPRVCEDLIVGDAKIRAAAVEEALNGIKGDLASPGRTVVSIDLSILFDPVFQQKLQRLGATVLPPRE